jgi:hypothetical protein
MFDPLIFVNDPETVMSGGFVKHDLSTVDAVFIVRPGVDAVGLLKALVGLFKTPAMQQVLGDLAPRKGTLQ